MPIVSALSINVDLNLDPIGLIRDYRAKRKEQKDLNALKGKFFEVKSNGQKSTGLLSSFESLGASTWLILETQTGPEKIALDKVETMKEVKKKFRLAELLQITKSRDSSRATSLTWLLAGARPVRDNAKKWFDEEVARARHQIHILVDLFPQRSHQKLESELDGVAGKFDHSIAMLDEVLRLVESREVSQVKEIFHGERRSLPPGYLEKEVPEEPDVGVAFVGLFFAATELNELVTKIDGIVDSYEDMMTVFKIATDDSP